MAERLITVLERPTTDVVAVLNNVSRLTAGRYDSARAGLLPAVPAFTHMLMARRTPHAAKVLLVGILGHMAFVAGKVNAMHQTVLAAALTALHDVMVKSINIEDEGPHTLATELAVVNALQCITHTNAVNTTTAAKDFADLLVIILMQRASDELRLKATQLLARLCAVHREARGPATACGGVIALLLLLANPSNTMRAVAASALIHMCHQCQHAQDTLEACGGVPTLARLFPSSFSAAGVAHQGFQKAQARICTFFRNVSDAVPREQRAERLAMLQKAAEQLHQEARTALAACIADVVGRQSP